jgi:hypothetical protein
MRKLTLDDIRITRGGNVIAAPLWAYECRGGYCDAIAEAWADIRPELARRWIEQCKSIGARFKRTPQTWHQRSIAHGYYALMRECLVCGETFLALNADHSPTVCTEKCWRAWRKQNHKQSTRPRPHVSHDERLCPQCHEAFKPRRADAVFCSGRCRVAHHRQGS